MQAMFPIEIAMSRNSGQVSKTDRQVWNTFDLVHVDFIYLWHQRSEAGEVGD